MAVVVLWCGIADVLTSAVRVFMEPLFDGVAPQEGRIATDAIGGCADRVDQHMEQDAQECTWKDHRGGGFFAAVRENADQGRVIAGGGGGRSLTVAPASAWASLSPQQSPHTA